jgi:hypothetical protein
MGSSRKSKSTRAKGARPHERPTRPGVSRKAVDQPLAPAPEIPDGAGREIESQRRVLITVITLLHCLHVVLEQREDNADEQFDPRIKTAVNWAYLPDLTAMLLERTHAIHLALDSVNLIKASKALEP